MDVEPMDLLSGEVRFVAVTAMLFVLYTSAIESS
jgi:hypothetical protein